MKFKLNKKIITCISKKDQNNDMESHNLKRFKYKDRFATITFLRECFYGPEATTGRIQRVVKVIKRKKC